MNHATLVGPDLTSSFLLVALVGNGYAPENGTSGTAGRQVAARAERLATKDENSAWR